MVTVRREEPDDREAVRFVVKRAFDGAEHADGNEAELVDALRRGDAFVPELSLVAEWDGEIAGHIMFTKAWVGEHAVLALAPLSVLPEYQGKGIGTALLQEGHRIARELGYGYSVVLGSETYYPRVGYLAADRFGILPPFDVPGENFMAYRLRDDAPVICGTLKYAKEFGIN